MRMPKWAAFVAAAALAAAGFSGLAAADEASVASAAYDGFSLSAPTASSVTVCHGFGCKYRSEVGLTRADWAILAQLLGAGKGSAAGELRGVAAAGAWFDRRIAPSAGTEGHVARAGTEYMFDKGQFDCVDSSRNTTSLLLILEQLGLLRYHDVAEPEARGYLIDGRPPHVTAVLVDKKSGVQWAVDSWTRGYGQAPEIMPLARWMTLD